MLNPEPLSRMRRATATLALCLLLTAAFLFMPARQPAGACSPTDTPMPGMPTEIPDEMKAVQESQAASVIIEGTVIDFTISDSQEPTTINIVRFQVDQYDKGHGPQVIQVVGNFSLFCPMVPPFDKGSKLIFLLPEQPTTTQPARATEWFSVDDTQVTAAIRNSIGHKPIAPDPGQAPDIIHPDPEKDTLSGFTIAILVIAVFLFGFWWAARRVIKRLPRKYQ